VPSEALADAEAFVEAVVWFFSPVAVFAGAASAAGNVVSSAVVASAIDAAVCVADGLVGVDSPPVFTVAGLSCVVAPAAGSPKPVGADGAVGPVAPVAAEPAMAAAAIARGALASLAAGEAAGLFAGSAVPGIAAAAALSAVSGVTSCEVVLAAPLAGASSADVLSLAVLSVFVLPADLPASDLAVVALPSPLSGAAVLESVASAPPDCAPDESSGRPGGVWSAVDVLSRDDLSDAEFRVCGAGGGGGDGSGPCAGGPEGSDWKLLSSSEAKPPSGGDGSRTGDFGGALE